MKRERNAKLGNIKRNRTTDMYIETCADRQVDRKTNRYINRGWVREREREKEVDR